MMQLLNRYQWIVDHPLEVFGLIVILLAVAYVIGAVIFAVMYAHEEKKQERQRRDFERIMKASTPRAPGIGSRRIG